MINYLHYNITGNKLKFHVQHTEYFRFNKNGIQLMPENRHYFGKVIKGQWHWKDEYVSRHNYAPLYSFTMTGGSKEDEAFIRFNWSDVRLNASADVGILKRR